MKKSLIFKILYLFLVLIVVAGASVFATNTYLASQVSYGNSNVEDALNGLFTLKENTYNYSTDEQVIGKWIDNKPIYRTLIITTLPTSTKAGTQVDKYIDFDYNIEKIIDIHGIKNYDYTSDSDASPIPQANHTTAWTALGYDRNSKRIWLRNSHPGWSNLSVYIIIEYTKTTD